jgi:hypothetical protein
MVLAVLLMFVAMVLMVLVAVAVEVPVVDLVIAVAQGESPQVASMMRLIAMFAVHHGTLPSSGTIFWHFELLIITLRDNCASCTLCTQRIRCY